MSEQVFSGMEFQVGDEQIALFIAELTAINSLIKDKNSPGLSANFANAVLGIINKSQGDLEKCALTTAEHHGNIFGVDEVELKNALEATIANVLAKFPEEFEARKRPTFVLESEEELTVEITVGRSGFWGIVIYVDPPSDDGTHRSGKGLRLPYEEVARIRVGGVVVWANQKLSGVSDELQDVAERGLVEIEFFKGGAVSEKLPKNVEALETFGLSVGE